MTAAHLKSLQAQFSHLPGITFETHNELVAVHVHNEVASARVFLQGAQLSHYQHHGEPPIIWCSPHCDYSAGTPLRGGVPVCWPWFGNLVDNHHVIQRQVGIDNPSAHGFVRNRQWQLKAIEQPDSTVTRLVFSLELAEQQESAWPTATSLCLTITIGKRLQMFLDFANRHRHPVYVSAALHTYYAVSDINTVSVRGLDGLNYRDSLQQGQLNRQRGDLIIDQEVDRIYHGTWNPITLVDQGWNRALIISSEGSDSSVLWNPWQDKARRLSHFADDAYREMLCIETANADDDFVVLKPGERHRLGFTLRCRPLRG